MRRNPAKSIAMTSVTVALIVISALGLGLRTSNVALGRSNSALKVKTLEAQASASEARNSELLAETKAEEARRKTEDVLRLSLSQDYADLMLEASELWPVHPSRIEALQLWSSKAAALSEELPALVEKRDELRALAIPLNEDESRARRATHPAYEDLVSLLAEVASKRAALSVRRGETKPEVVEVEWKDYPPSASDLNGLAWKLVDPARESYGQEALGLALATHAAELAPMADKAGILDSVAWAYFALGDDIGALAASREALALAPNDKRAEFESYVMKMETGISKASNAEGLASAGIALSKLTDKVTALEARVNERQKWTFPEEDEANTRARWWHNQVTSLIADIDSLSTPEVGLLTESGVSEEHGWSVVHRLKFTQRIEESFADGGEYAQRWSTAKPELDAAYPELNIQPQLGLVPIGTDPASKLWEFWNVLSGAEPMRDDDGALIIEEESGLVFVLLRGGKFWMGAQATDPEGQNYDTHADDNESPVHEVTLSAFFLSKYEMTQGQWLRLAGHNPSSYGPKTKLGEHQNDLTHPIEQVSWVESMKLLSHARLTLPSEAQWEYGARAGTSWPWWTGNDRESLRTKAAVNLADQAATRAGAVWPGTKDWPELDDGYPAHAPVDEYAANAFGLHNVHGNVWEWCLDGYDEHYYEQEVVPDPVSHPEGSTMCVFRGGAFIVTAAIARSAMRGGSITTGGDGSVGLRPARAVEK